MKRIVVIAMILMALSATVHAGALFSDTFSNGTLAAKGYYTYHPSETGVAWLMDTNTGWARNGWSDGNRTDGILVKSFKATMIDSVGESITLCFQYGVGAAEAGRNLRVNLYSLGSAFTNDQFAGTSPLAGRDGYGFLQELGGATTYFRKIAGGTESNVGSGTATVSNVDTTNPLVQYELVLELVPGGLQMRGSVDGIAMATQTVAGVSYFLADAVTIHAPWTYVVNKNWRDSKIQSVEVKSVLDPESFAVDFMGGDDVAIVIPTEPEAMLDNEGMDTMTQSNAAVTLQMLIENATGYTAPIIDDSAPSFGKRIFVGFGSHLEGVVTPPTEPEGVKITTHGDDIVIIGEIAPAGINNWTVPVDRGTMHAVEFFAERVMGYRFLFSSRSDANRFNLGTVVPSIGTLNIVAPLLIEEHPAFQLRTTHGYFQDCMGLQAGGSRAFYGNHAHDMTYWKSQYEYTDPQLFVLKDNGGRDEDHLDFAEPDVLDKEIDHLTDWFDFGINTGYKPGRTPTDRYVVFGQTDGYAVNGSYSTAAQYWERDDPDYWGCDMVTSDSFRYSDLIFDYIRRLADEVEANWPRMRLSALAYQWSNYIPTPSLFTNFPGNVDIMLTLMRSSTQNKQPEVYNHNLSMLQDWASFLGDDRDRLFLWEYMLWPGQYANSPTLPPHKLQDWIQAVEPYVSGVFLNGTYHPPTPLNHMLYRLWMRLLWDPYLDVDAEIDDLCLKFYGPAGPAMANLYHEMIDAYEIEWDNATLYYNQFYAHPDLYYGQSYTAARLWQMATLLEQAREAAGMPPELVATVNHGSAVYLMNIEDEPFGVDMVLSWHGTTIIDPVVVWDDGRLSYDGTVSWTDQLIIDASGSAWKVTSGVTNPVTVDFEGELPLLTAGEAKVFSFYQENAGGSYPVSLSYGTTNPPPGSATYTSRMDWFREAFLVFHPVDVYGGAGAEEFTGLFAAAHVAHRHLGSVPTNSPSQMDSPPLAISDPAWTNVVPVGLVRGRETPAANIGQYAYMSQNNVLPYNNLGFPADVKTEVKCAYSTNGLSFLVSAQDAALPGESLTMVVGSQTSSVPVTVSATTNANVQQVDIGSDGWDMLLEFTWDEIDGIPVVGNEQIIDLQIQRDRGDNDYIWSPPLGSPWGHDQQGLGRLVVPVETIKQTIIDDVFTNGTMGAKGYYSYHYRSAGQAWYMDAANDWARNGEEGGARAESILIKSFDPVMIGSIGDCIELTFFYGAGYASGSGYDMKVNLYNLGSAFTNDQFGGTSPLAGRDGYGYLQTQGSTTTTFREIVGGTESNVGSGDTTMSNVDTANPLIMYELKLELVDGGLQMTGSVGGNAMTTQTVSGVTSFTADAVSAYALFAYSGSQSWRDSKLSGIEVSVRKRVPAFYDSQGVPYSWYEQFGYTSNFSSVGTLDPDGDGFLNWEEYVVDTIPTNGASYPTFGIDAAAIIFFESSTNCTYTVERKQDLVADPWDVFTNIPGTGATVDLYDTNAVQRFFQLKIQRP